MARTLDGHDMLSATDCIVPPLHRTIAAGRPLPDRRGTLCGRASALGLEVGLLLSHRARRWAVRHDRVEVVPRVGEAAPTLSSRDAPRLIGNPSFSDALPPGSEHRAGGASTDLSSFGPPQDEHQEDRNGH